MLLLAGIDMRSVKRPFFGCRACCVVGADSLEPHALNSTLISARFAAEAALATATLATATLAAAAIIAATLAAATLAAAAALAHGAALGASGLRPVQPDELRRNGLFGILGRRGGLGRVLRRRFVRAPDLLDAERHQHGQQRL